MQHFTGRVITYPWWDLSSTMLVKETPGGNQIFINILATDHLMLKHQALSILNTGSLPIVPKQLLKKTMALIWTNPKTKLFIFKCHYM